MAKKSSAARLREKSPAASKASTPPPVASSVKESHGSVEAKPQRVTLSEAASMGDQEAALLTELMAMRARIDEREAVAHEPKWSPDQRAEIKAGVAADRAALTSQLTTLRRLRWLRLLENESGADSRYWPPKAREKRTTFLTRLVRAGSDSDSGEISKMLAIKARGILVETVERTAWGPDGPACYIVAPLPEPDAPLPFAGELRFFARTLPSRWDRPKPNAVQRFQYTDNGRFPVEPTPGPRRSAAKRRSDASLELDALIAQWATLRPIVSPELAALVDAILKSTKGLLGRQEVPDDKRLRSTVDDLVDAAEQLEFELDHQAVRREPLADAAPADDARETPHRPDSKPDSKPDSAKKSPTSKRVLDAITGINRQWAADDKAGKRRTKKIVVIRAILGNSQGRNEADNLSRQVSNYCHLLTPDSPD